MKESGVYAILHIPSGKRYIGSTKSFKKRIRDHETMLNGGGHHSKEMQKTWNDSETNEFEFYQLEPGVEQGKLFEREQFWIDFFDSGKTGFNTLLIAGQVPWEDERFKWFSGRVSNKKTNNIKFYPLLYRFKKYKNITVNSKINKREGAYLNLWFDRAKDYVYKKQMQENTPKKEILSNLEKISIRKLKTYIKNYRPTP